MARAPIPQDVQTDVEKARRLLLSAWRRLDGASAQSLDRIVARLESWQRGNGGEPS